MPAKAARTVEEYLGRLPDAQREALERVRRLVRAAAPGVTEKIGYGMPGFYLDGRGLVWVGAFRHHCSLHPGSLRFTPDAPLPAATVKKLVRSRIAATRKAPTRGARTGRPRRPTR